MPEVKLTYFDIKARAELTRILLAAGGIPYEDNRVNFPPTHGVEQWMALKPKTPLKQLPGILSSPVITNHVGSPV